MKKKIVLFATICLIGLFGILVTNCKKDTISEYDGADYIDMDYENFFEFVDLIPPGASITFDKMIVDDFYEHMYQKTSGVRCGGRACLPTSYMMARKILLPSAEFSVEELNNLSDKFNMPDDCSYGTAIDEAAYQAKEDFGDCNPGKFKKKSTSTNPSNDESRTATKEKIMEWLDMDKPLITRIQVKKNGVVTDKKSGTYCHFVVIVGLKMTDVGTGSTVYYIDPLTKTAQVKSCDLTYFLNSMKCDNKYYYLLPIGCNN